MESAVMPIFEYICRACHHRFETLVTASRTPACPACQAEGLDKQHSVFAVAAKSSSSSPAIGACGACGDPRGPGSCSVN
jgi:putative FmdB family regulatory protein